MVKNKAIEEAAKELRMPYNRVEKIYRAFWKYVRHHIESLPIKGVEMSKEEYESYRPSVSLSYLGRIHCSYDDIVKMKKGYEKACREKDTSILDSSVHN